MKHTILVALASVGLAAPAPSLAQAPGERSALPERSCDYDCLIAMVQQHMTALEAGDASPLPVSGDVLFTENNVPIALGTGLWDTVRDVDDHGLAVADETTGHAAWFGSVRENDHAAFYAVRIHVEDGLIDEIESVIHRQTGLPAPFGDWENMVHFPEFAEILPEEERRPRERMLAIADAYFDTVELNDGQVFAPFSEDCSRLENGILTTAVREGEQQSAAAIASGCREQFELGIYRINKRIRRQLPLVDERRGVVVASGFFDHANEFDRYLLTNGNEMRTALKWPNSITLLEAFRIRNAEIQRIEATFTYVPYFMHNPFWGEDAEFPLYAARPDECSAQCLSANARALVSAMVGNRWQDLNWSDNPVGYAENSVGIRVGESIWRTITAVDDDPLVIADAGLGRAVWIGRIEEHGQPAWAAITMNSDGDTIGSVDALIRRSEYGAPWEEGTSAPDFSVLQSANRTSRSEMMAGAHELLQAIEANGAGPQVGLTPGCAWTVNGQELGECETIFGSGMSATISEMRDVRLLATDEERGLAVYRYFEDHDGTGPDSASYPRTFQVLSVVRFDSGRIDAVTSFKSELPFGMTALEER